MLTLTQEESNNIICGLVDKFIFLAHDRFKKERVGLTVDNEALNEMLLYVNAVATWGQGEFLWENYENCLTASQMESIHKRVNAQL